jgi:GNAT superfamily N-acetyltransferase
MQDNHNIDLINATHLREVLRYIAEVSQLELKVSGDYIAITTSETTAGFNYLSGIGEDSAEFIPLIDYFKQHNRSFAWFSFPQTPVLERTLVDNRLVHIAPVACVTCDLSQETEAESNADFVPVTTPEQFDAWCQILASTWNRTVDITKRFYRGLYPSSRMQLYLVRKDQHYAGCCILDIQGAIAGCYWDCVLPEFRQQGLGTIMIEQRKAIAKTHGCTHIVAQCLDSSVGIYQKAGFKKGENLALYRFVA